MDIRTRILVACRDLCSEKGISKFTVDELAQRANISKRTLYRYFRSKDDIISATFTDFMQAISADIDQIVLKESDPSVVIAHVLEYLAVHGSFFTHTKALMDLHKRYPFIWEEINSFRINKITDLIRKMRHKEENSHFDKNTEIIIINVIIAAVQAIINPEFLLKNDISFQEAANKFSRMIIKLLAD